MRFLNSAVGCIKKKNKVKRELQLRKRKSRGRAKVKTQSVLIHVTWTVAMFMVRWIFSYFFNTLLLPSMYGEIHCDILTNSVPFFVLLLGTLECVVPEHATTVVEEHYMASIDTTEWVLSNGIKVVYKRMPHQTHQVCRFRFFLLFLHLINTSIV